MYGAAKAAVKLLTEGLYAELLETGVGVSVIMPGAVATNIADNSGVRMPTASETPSSPALKPLPARDAARIILDGIEADRLHIPVGRDARLMYLLSRIAPRRSTHLLHRQMKVLLGE